MKIGHFESYYMVKQTGKMKPSYIYVHTEKSVEVFQLHT